MRKGLTVLFISGLTGLILTRCATIPPQTEKLIEKSDSLDRDIESSDATPEQKANMKQKNNDLREGIKTQGKALVEKDAEILRLKWYEKIFWQIACAVGGAIVASFIFWRLRR